MSSETISIAGTQPIQAHTAALWAILQDPMRLQAAMPDCEQLIYLGNRQYWGVLNVHAGVVQRRFAGKISLTEWQPGVGYSLVAEGYGAEERLVGNGRIWLEAAGEITHLHYEGEIQVNGELAEVGRPYLETVARAIIRQNMTALAALATGEETAVMHTSPSRSQHTRSRLLIFLSGFLLALLVLLSGGFLLFKRFYRLWLRHVAREVAALLKGAPHAS